MSANSIFRVTYHFEKSGKRVCETVQDDVIAADNSYSSLSTVLSNNGKTNGGNGTLVITGCYSTRGVGNVLS